MKNHSMIPCLAQKSEFQHVFYFLFLQEEITNSLSQLFSFICRLKGRVLIKGKRLMDSEAQASDDSDSDDDSEIGDEHRTMVEARGSPVSMDRHRSRFSFLVKELIILSNTNFMII